MHGMPFFYRFTVMEYSMIEIIFAASLGERKFTRYMVDGIQVDGLE